MPDAEAAARLEANARQFGRFYLEGYRRMLEPLLREKGKTIIDITPYSPLLAGQLEKDFSISVLCEPFGTWMVFSSAVPGKYRITEERKFDEEWGFYTISWEEKVRQVCEALDLSPDTVIAADRLASPGVLCADREHRIERYAGMYGRGQARADFLEILKMAEAKEQRDNWERITQQIKVAMDSAGTQESGIQFQDGISRALALAGCDPRDVRIVGQQIDASCWVAGSPVVIEMLNSRDPAGVEDGGDLVRKLTTRPASVVGVLCSPSGFTPGAIKETERLANVRTILLWGRARIDQLLEGPDRVSQLFLEHYRAFIDQAGRQQP